MSRSLSEWEWVVTGSRGRRVSQISVVKQLSIISTDWTHCVDLQEDIKITALIMNSETVLQVLRPTLNRI